MAHHGNKGRKQTKEHIRKRMESVAKAKAEWTPEQVRRYRDNVSKVARNRDPSWIDKFRETKRANGKPAWNKGRKCPQWSGESHWNHGNNMSQESIEKMRQSKIGKKQSIEHVAKRVAGRAGYRHSEETRERIRKSNIETYSNPEVRAKHTGENSPSWRGGISFEPYPVTWTFRLREAIRERDGRKCKACGVGENGKRHDVHHIDYNKENVSADNLVTLCIPCHRKTNYNRQEWIDFFTRNQGRL